MGKEKKTGSYSILKRKQKDPDKPLVDIRH